MKQPKWEKTLAALGAPAHRNSPQFDNWIRGRKKDFDRLVDSFIAGEVDAATAQQRMKDFRDSSKLIQTALEQRRKWMHSELKRIHAGERAVKVTVLNDK